MAIKDQKKCSAKSKRSGQHCKALAMANGKCRVHGGKTPKGLNSPNLKHGGYSSYLPKGFAERTDQFAADPNYTELKEAIGVQKTRITELFAELEEREPVEVWRKLKRLYLRWQDLLKEVEFDEFGEVPDDYPKKQAIEFAQVEFETLLINGCAAEEKADMVWKKIEASQDRLRKLNETESKRIKESGEFITKEGFAIYNLYVQQIIIENVPDAAVRNTIADKLISAGLK